MLLHMRSIKKVGLIAGILLLIAFAVFFYLRFYFVFGDGVKAGELNQFTLKGVVFKTYEGRIIQAGFKSGANVGVADSSMGSYVFDFSVDNQTVADSLMHCSGKHVEVHYKEYFGALPWRGVHTHVVDRIISVKNISPTY